MTSNYTLADLRAAEEKLAALEERGIGSDRHSNPDTRRGAISRARTEVDLIRTVLKATGQLPKTERELLWEQLDAKFPHNR